MERRQGPERLVPMIPKKYAIAIAALRSQWHIIGGVHLTPRGTIWLLPTKQLTRLHPSSQAARFQYN